MGNVLPQTPKDRARSVSGRVTLTPQHQPGSKYHLRKHEHVGSYYEVVEELGRGHFSYTLKVRNKQTGALLVCKAVTKQVVCSANRQTSNSMHVHREADLMEHLSSLVTADLVEVFEDDAMYHLIIDLPHDGKRLDEALLLMPPTESTAADVIRMAARCVDHCHNRGVIHRGISPSAFTMQWTETARPQPDEGGAPATGSAAGAGVGAGAGAGPGASAGSGEKGSSVTSTSGQVGQGEGSPPQQAAAASSNGATPGAPPRCAAQVVITGVAEPEDAQACHANGHRPPAAGQGPGTAPGSGGSGAGAGGRGAGGSYGASGSGGDAERRRSGGDASTRTSQVSAGQQSHSSGETRPRSAPALLARLCGGGGEGRSLRSGVSRNNSSSYDRSVRLHLQMSLSRLGSVGGLASLRGPQALKLSEFEDARFVTRSCRFTSLRGSFLHAAPEMVRKHLASGDATVPSYGPEVDVWALGVLLYSLLAGRMPFVEDNMSDTLYSILNDPVDFASEPWPHISDQAQGLVAAMLDKNPRTRFTARQVLHHPFVSEVHAQSRPCYEGPSELWSARNALRVCMREARRFSAYVVDLAEAQQLLVAAQQVQRSGGGAVAAVERVLATVLSGSGVKASGARRSQLQELHQILRVLDVQTECLNDLVHFLTAMLNITSMMHDEMLCKILCSLPRPSKTSGKIQPRDVIHILGTCDRVPNISRRQSTSQQSRTIATNIPVAEKLITQAVLHDGGTPGCPPTRPSPPKASQGVEGPTPKAQACESLPPAWVPPGVVVQQKLGVQDA